MRQNKDTAEVTKMRLWRQNPLWFTPKLMSGCRQFPRSRLIKVFPQELNLITSVGFMYVLKYFPKSEP